MLKSSAFIFILLKNLNNNKFTGKISFFSLLTIFMPLIQGLCWGVWERAILHQIDLSLNLNSTIYWPHGFKSLNISKLRFPFL